MLVVILILSFSFKSQMLSWQQSFISEVEIVAFLDFRHYFNFYMNFGRAVVQPRSNVKFLHGDVLCRSAMDNDNTNMRNYFHVNHTTESVSKKLITVLYKIHFYVEINP